MPFFDMSGIILKSAVTKPSTRKYPFVKRANFLRTRGGIRIEIDKCIFCSICAKKCPTNAIKVSKDEKTWSIDRLQCTACSYCVDMCPKKCLHNVNDYSPSTTERTVEVFKNA